MSSDDYYKALGLDSTKSLGISDEDVKTAYYGLAKKWHPDSNSTPEALNRFRLVSEAYENLKTKDLRSAYRFDMMEATDDWSRAKQRNSRKGRDADYRSNFNNVNIEYDAADKKWRATQQNSRQTNFFRSFERTIHPKNLFLLIPLGIFTYFGLRYAVSSVYDMFIKDSKLEDNANADTPYITKNKKKKKAVGPSASRVSRDIGCMIDEDDDSNKVLELGLALALHNGYLIQCSVAHLEGIM